MAKFEPAIAVVMRHEGGFQKKPSDPGNWTGKKVGLGVLKGTKYGISAHTFPDVDIENLTLDGAEALYRRDWWKYDAIEDQSIATKVMDLAVNWERFGGHGPAIEVLQKAICACGGQVKIDGTLGLQTVAACNAIDPLQLLRQIRQQALLRYKEIERNHPEEAEWFEGWEARAIS